jgi:hypothetical protein
MTTEPTRPDLELARRLAIENDYFYLLWLLDMLEEAEGLIKLSWANFTAAEWLRKYRGEE